MTHTGSSRKARPPKAFGLFPTGESEWGHRQFILEEVAVEKASGICSAVDCQADDGCHRVAWASFLSCVRGYFRVVVRGGQRFPSMRSIPQVGPTSSKGPERHQNEPHCHKNVGAGPQL